MSFMQGGIMGLVKQKMSYDVKKQSVFAQNVANANTPDYKAKTLKPFESYINKGASETAAGMAVTNQKHIVPASVAAKTSQTTKMNSFETVPTGNSVDLEQQMIEVTKTSLDHSAGTALYAKMTGMFRTALGRK